MAKRTPARKRTKKAACPASLVWFDIPADDLARAKKFYSALFGWKITRFPAMPDYWHIDTGGEQATLDGGLLPRQAPRQPITAYVSVPSVEKAGAKVQKLGGKICKPKTPVPGMDYFVVCQDTEENTFALWEMNPKAT
ncbi:MAG: glyoxalase [Nitrospira sp. SCN 59-13]|nr:MAG: glyoxalase [Nitrospira sp. SCN 59-13]